jgi:hypothetical protein
MPFKFISHCVARSPQREDRDGKRRLYRDIAATRKILANGWQLGLNNQYHPTKPRKNAPAAIGC